MQSKPSIMICKTELESLRATVLRQIVHDLFDTRIMSNLARPHYVERMIVYLLGSGWTHVGGNWAGWDIQHDDGTRVEVKQSAARQTWSERPDRRGKRTRPIFDIRARSGFFEGGSLWVPNVGRSADLYIFAWHDKYEPRCEVDHGDPAQWIFLVLSAEMLPAKSKTIGLPSVQRLGAAAADYKTLAKVIGDMKENIPRRNRELAAVAQTCPQGSSGASQ